MQQQGKPKKPKLATELSLHQTKATAKSKITTRKAKETILSYNLKTSFHN